jgi:methylmalonyl-CoA mutase cobalamin-binding subunit
MGVKEIFTPGAPLEEIVKFVNSIERQKDRAREKDKAKTRDRAK